MEVAVTSEGEIASTYFSTSYEGFTFKAIIIIIIVGKAIAIIVIIRA